VHILVVEDEQRLGRLLRRSLEANRHVVDVVTEGKTGLAAALGGSYDLLILDLGLPDLDGLEVCRRLRAAGLGTPVLVLTARAEIEDRVRGLDAGADDYLAKPFALAELLARVRALARRPRQLQGERELQVADLVLDVAGHRARRGERPIALSAKEFALLDYLMRHAGQVLTRQQIVEHVWRYDFEGLDTIVDTYIHYLREKIDAGTAQRLVHTVRGVGYVLRAE
jgi:DNA-binding response OmpR family regulator